MKASSGGVLGADLQHSKGTNSPISNTINASSGADLQHSNGTNSLIFSGTKSLISYMMNASSGALLGADLQHSNGTNSLISNTINASSGANLQHSNMTNSLISNGTNTLISYMMNASSGALLGADLQHSNGTNSPISYLMNASSGALLGADFQHSNGTNSPISTTINASSVSLSGLDSHHPLLAVLALALAGTALSLSLSVPSLRARPRSPSSILLLHLALPDLLFLAALSLRIHSPLPGEGEAACGLAEVLFRLHGSLSVALLGCLAGHAWLAALRPLSAARLRGRHFALLPAALWLPALAASVPVLLQGTELNGCFGSSPHGWTPPAVLGFVFEALFAFSVTLLGLPLAAGSVWRRGRGAARRKALGTISAALGISALCFVPQHLSQGLQFLGLRQEPFPSLLREALGGCGCCLKPLLYLLRSSGRPWRCPCRLRRRAQRVFTVCDRNFGDPSWDYEAGPRLGKENPRGWKRLIRSGYARS